MGVVSSLSAGVSIESLCFAASIGDSMILGSELEEGVSTAVGCSVSIFNNKYPQIYG